MSGASGYGTRGSARSIIVRLLVGLVVFLPEGIQKLAFPDLLGAGRFVHIGIPIQIRWVRSSVWSRLCAVC